MRPGFADLNSSLGPWLLTLAMTIWPAIAKCRLANPPRCQPIPVHGASSQPAADAFTLEELASSLERCTGRTDAREVARYLDAIREMGTKAASLSAMITSLLSHNSPLFHDRDRIDALRLRAYLFATLADIGVPRSAAPFIIDALSDLDEHAVAAEVGGAARAAGAYGAAGRPLLPFLLPALNAATSDQEFTLDHFDAPPGAGQTTIKLEVIRAVRRLGVTDDPRVIEALSNLAEERQAHVASDPRVVEAAKEALSVPSSGASGATGATGAAGAAGEKAGQSARSASEK